MSGEGGGEERAKILARVKKMLTLANNSAASEGERENAMRMAHATLAKYNLTISEAESAGGATIEQRMIEGQKTVGYPWTRHVAMGVAELFFCETFYVRNSPRYHTIYFVGRAANVFTCKSMLAYLYDSITREAVKKSREQFLVGEGAYQRNFAKGAARVIYHRCSALREEAEAASRPKPTMSSSTALVLSSVYKAEEDANASYMKDQGLKIKETSSRESQPGAGFRDGVEHGRSVSLNRQIGGGEERKKLK